MVLKTIAAPLLELGEKIGRPLGLIFVGILIDGPRHRAMVASKGIVEPDEIMANCLAIERVKHGPFTARRSALDGSAGSLSGDGIDGPFASTALPFDRAGRIDTAQEIDDLS